MIFCLPIATPDINRPKHKFVMFVDNPIIVQPIKNGIDVNCTVVFLPKVCINTPDINAPKGLDITPKLAVKKNNTNIKFAKNKIIDYKTKKIRLVTKQ